MIEHLSCFLNFPIGKITVNFLVNKSYYFLKDAEVELLD